MKFIEFLFINSTSVEKEVMVMNPAEAKPYIELMNSVGGMYKSYRVLTSQEAKEFIKEFVKTNSEKLSLIKKYNKCYGKF